LRSLCRSLQTPRLILVRVTASPLTESVTRNKRENIASARAAITALGRELVRITAEADIAAAIVRTDTDVQVAEAIVRADIDELLVEIIVRAAIAIRADLIRLADIQPVDTENHRFTDATEMPLT